MFLTIIEKEKLRKQSQPIMEKIDIQVPREQLSTFQPKIVKKHERNISRIEDQIFFYIQKECLQETFGNNISNVLLWFIQRHNF